MARNLIKTNPSPLSGRLQQPRSQPGPLAVMKAFSRCVTSQDLMQLWMSEAVLRRCFSHLVGNTDVYHLYSKSSYDTERFISLLNITKSYICSIDHFDHHILILAGTLVQLSFSQLHLLFLKAPIIPSLGLSGPK